ncbi:MAG: zinc ribbon domain-containing protein [Actinomycetia bacterium]|nr:zinc ribbon domain-containing protein [Actinomycetes bacterium]
MFCPNCGKEATGNSRYCSSCGYDFAASSAAVGPTVIGPGTPADQNPVYPASASTPGQPNMTSTVQPNSTTMQKILSVWGVLLGACALLLPCVTVTVGYSHHYAPSKSASLIDLIHTGSILGAYGDNILAFAVVAILLWIVAITWALVNLVKTFFNREFDGRFFILMTIVSILAIIAFFAADIYLAVQMNKYSNSGAWAMWLAPPSLTAGVIAPAIWSWLILAGSLTGMVISIGSRRRI